MDQEQIDRNIATASAINVLFRLKATTVHLSACPECGTVNAREHKRDYPCCGYCGLLYDARTGQALEGAGN
jgi:ribosomal protein S27AE